MVWFRIFHLKFEITLLRCAHVKCTLNWEEQNWFYKMCMGRKYVQMSLTQVLDRNFKFISEYTLFMCVLLFLWMQSETVAQCVVCGRILKAFINIIGFYSFRKIYREWFLWQFFVLSTASEIPIIFCNIWNYCHEAQGYCSRYVARGMVNAIQSFSIPGFAWSVWDQTYQWNPDGMNPLNIKVPRRSGNRLAMFIHGHATTKKTSIER